MPFNSKHSRRDFLSLLSALGLGSLVNLPASAQQGMPLRQIPSSGESLPIIGLGSSKVVSQIADNGTEPVAAVLRALVDNGGALVDTWPRDPLNDSGFGSVINQPDLRDNLFVTTKVSLAGSEGAEQLAESLRSYGRETIDLAQIFSLTDLETHWPMLQEWKETGKARYIGVTVSQYENYEALIEFLGRETPDFIQCNYSITERLAEERLLPLAADKGIGVIINRPFMNGDYFRRLASEPLPEWAEEIGIRSWAEFSLKYILPHQAITSVLTETSNPEHMVENALAAYGVMPDMATRRRMAAFMDQL